MPSPEPEIAVAGHLCLDLIPEMTSGGRGGLRPGALVRVGPMQAAPGGAVANVGLALHRLGVRTILMGKVGEDQPGRELTRILRAHDGMLAGGLDRLAGETTSYSIVLSPPGLDRTFLHCSGANDRFGMEDVDWEKVQRVRLLHFGYPPLMRRMYAGGGRELATLMERARQCGAATSLDMAAVDPESEAADVDWPSLLGRVLPHVDLFQPSLDELLAMLGREAGEGPPDASLLEELGERIIGWGAAVAAIKLGEDGLYLHTSRDPGRLERVGRGLLDPASWCGCAHPVPCFQVRVVGTTGSGDCTVAGLLAAVLRGEKPDQAARAATAVGACGVEAADATTGVRPWHEIQQRLDAGWPTRPPAEA